MILSWEVNNIISCQFFSRHAKQMLNIDQSGHGFLSQSNSGSFVFVADITKYLYVVESFWRRLMRLRYFRIGIILDYFSHHWVTTSLDGLKFFGYMFIDSEAMGIVIMLFDTFRLQRLVLIIFAIFCSSNRVYGKCWIKTGAAAFESIVIIHLVTISHFEQWDTA